MKEIEEIVRILKENRTFILATHINPDGDGLGSELALAQALEQMGKTVTVANTDGMPLLYEFLPCSDKVKDKISPDARFDVALIVECPDIGRIGQVINLEQQAKTVVNIDHHGDNKYYGHVNWVEGDTAAVGEQIFRLITALGARITPEIAICLFAAIYTDTGGFAYSNTRQETFLAAAELMRYGVKPHLVVGAIEQNHSLSRVKLLGLALSTLETTPDGKISWIDATQEMIRKSGAQKEDTEGFVDYPRSLKATEVAVFFRETEKGEIKVSLRSKGQVNVSAVAHQFQGGGHAAAAGFTLTGTLEDARQNVLKEIKRALSEIY